MRVAVTGSQGKLGQALLPALEVAGWTVRGHARLHAEVAGDRRDPAVLARLLDGIDAVVDLAGFDANDAQRLIDAAPRGCRLVFASSLAALTADDDYGRGKRDAEQTFAARWPGPQTAVRLPHLVGAGGRVRELDYLTQARRDGWCWLPGTGAQVPACAQVEVIAALCIALLGDPAPPPLVQVNHPQPQPVRALVAALLAGAGVHAELRPHPDRRWRGPHAGGDEPVEVLGLPPLAWPPLELSYRTLGATLAAAVLD